MSEVQQGSWRVGQEEDREPLKRRGEEDVRREKRRRNNAEYC